MRFDGADREIAATTGSTVSTLQGVPDPILGVTSAVTTEYTARGTIKNVAGSYGSLANKIIRTADGLVDTIQYGDIAGTTTSFAYDNRRRLASVQTYRGPPSDWTAPPPDYLPAPFFDASHQPTFQLLLQDEDYKYDSVNNPVEIRDWRIADEWPTGAKPVTRKMDYDDLYRLSHIDYQYVVGDDAWTPPFDAENTGPADLQDPRRAKPSPQTSFEKRVLWQSYGYDWLGNTDKSEDDAHGFYDRSLGTINNDIAANKPYQLKSASNKGPTAAPRDGQLEARYDATGNLTRLQVERNGTPSGTPLCLPSGAPCSQVFTYKWDEVGRLVEAKRWDVATLPSIDGLPPPAPAAVTLRNAYDAGDERVIKTAVDPMNAERHTVYVFDSLEIRGAVFDVSGSIDEPDYELSQWTEVPYLFAHGMRLARVAWDELDVPIVGGAQTHVFFELGDHLGSTSVVLDDE